MTPITIVLVTLFRGLLLQGICFAILHWGNTGRENKLAGEATIAKTTVPRKTLLSTYRTTIMPTQADAIAYFFLEGGVVYQNNFDGKKFSHNVPLEKLAETLDPDIFFRANRNYLVHRNAISHISKADNRKLELLLLDNSEAPIIVSKAKAGAFIKWLDG